MEVRSIAHIRDVLNCLRIMQALAFVGLDHVRNPFRSKQTKAKLIEFIKSFISKSIEFSNARFLTYMMKDDLRQIRDIVNALTDMLSNPLSLMHLCRVQVRKSLGRKFGRKLHQLNVPLPLQKYLRVYKKSDIVLSWFTRRIYVW